MFVRLGNRAVEIIVLFFAVLGFLFVPLGKRTGWEHARAIFATEAASEARQELGDAFERVTDSLVSTGDASQATDPTQMRLRQRSSDSALADRWAMCVEDHRPSSRSRPCVHRAASPRGEAATGLSGAFAPPAQLRPERSVDAALLEPSPAPANPDASPGECRLPPPSR